MKDWKPHRKQEKALLSECYETLYGGSRGGGKTDAGQAWLLYPIQEPRYRGLVVRKNYTDLTDWLDRAEVMYSGTGAKTINRNEIKFPSGAKILLGHLGDDNAYTKYQGHEYQRMLLEELTQIPTEELYLKLVASCRSTVDNLPARLFATCNPGGVGHSWVKRRFIDPSIPMQSFTDPISGRSRVYIPATVDDNPTLLEKDPDYVKFLEALPPDLKAQWRYGSWENFKTKGGIFSDEVYKAQEERRIGVVSLTPDVPVYTAWDLGVGDQQICWFFQIIGDQIKIIDLLFDSDKGYGHYIRALKNRGYYYGDVFLPHDGTKRSPDSLRSFKQELEDAGFDVKIIPRTKDKKRDIQQARIIFHRCYLDAERCATGIEALTQYRRRWLEEKNAYEDLPYHDWTSHYADAFMELAISVSMIKAPAAADNVQKAAADFINYVPKTISQERNEEIEAALSFVDS
jgi:hypothetical protein